MPAISCATKDGGFELDDLFSVCSIVVLRMNHHTKHLDKRLDVTPSSSRCALLQYLMVLGSWLTIEILNSAGEVENRNVLQ